MKAPMTRRIVQRFSVFCLGPSLQRLLPRRNILNHGRSRHLAISLLLVNSCSIHSISHNSSGGPPSPSATVTAATDLQADTNTWCKKAETEEGMATWARPIVEEVQRPPMPNFHVNPRFFSTRRRGHEASYCPQECFSPYTGSRIIQMSTAGCHLPTLSSTSHL